jgi:hypothetical protein|tara:strand:- start:593 stop:871 length:279 start_codon:yes stop_codon:yes gene_type:complete
MCRTDSQVLDAGTISEYTFNSRTRRAIRWLYWEPKSTMAMPSFTDLGPPSSSDPMPSRLLAISRYAETSRSSLVATRRPRGSCFSVVATPPW